MKKRIQLVNEHTAEFLLGNSIALEQAISAKQLDDTRLLALVNERDLLIESYLNSKSKLDKTFIQSELDNNEKLSKILSNNLKETESELHKFMRGSNIVKNYK